ncbi:hypothetical protein FB45DRAFT_997046 [Roridomyces roridus]|uniref:Uncharacterized protein n=1 Tax=Roridomyces roridus TaxID=1738132 RepID=A0AAD7G1H3_9AGAR|nr:hypothetical protein FB45DRAFT_997046 [Roridomyces roridus]
MSVCVQVQVDAIPTQRKRTASASSFSCDARPRKRLHRTESVLDLATLATEQPPPQQPESQPLPVQVPYNRTLRYYKEQKDRRRTLVRAALSPAPQTLTFTPTPLSLPPAPPIHQRKPQLPAARSPLARDTDLPIPSSPPPRALLIVPAAARARTTCGTGVPPGSSRPSPSSNSTSSSSRRSSPPSSCITLPPITPDPTTPKVTKPKPKRNPPQTLHRRAVLASLRATPHGAKILHMGARLAVGILGATAELERLCTPGTSHVEEEESDEDAEGEIDEELLLEGVMDVEPDFYLSDPEEAEPDVAMPDAELEMEMPPVLSASWVVLGESPQALNESRMQSRSAAAEQEWEMVE